MDQAELATLGGPLGAASLQSRVSFYPLAASEMMR